MSQKLMADGRKEKEKERTIEKIVLIKEYRPETRNLYNTSYYLQIKSNFENIKSDPAVCWWVRIHSLKNSL